MSRTYKFANPEGIYFITFATVGWVDVFTRKEYKDILIDSLPSHPQVCDLWDNCKTIIQKRTNFKVCNFAKTILCKRK